MVELLLNLRVSSINVVRAIRAWRQNLFDVVTRSEAAAGAPRKEARDAAKAAKSTPFMWATPTNASRVASRIGMGGGPAQKRVNYMYRMCQDLDFMSTCAPLCTALGGIKPESMIRNPFMAPDNLNATKAKGVPKVTTASKSKSNSDGGEDAEASDEELRVLMWVLLREEARVRKKAVAAAHDLVGLARTGPAGMAGMVGGDGGGRRARTPSTAGRGGAAGGESTPESSSVGTPFPATPQDGHGGAAAGGSVGLPGMERSGARLRFWYQEALQQVTTLSRSLKVSAWPSTAGTGREPVKKTRAQNFMSPGAGPVLAGGASVLAPLDHRAATPGLDAEGDAARKWEPLMRGSVSHPNLRSGGGHGTGRRLSASGSGRRRKRGSKGKPPRGGGGGDTSNHHLDRAALIELASLPNPPGPVVLVCATVMILLSPGDMVPKDLSWNSVRKDIAQASGLLKVLSRFDGSEIPQFKIRALQPFVCDVNFNPSTLVRYSAAAAALCAWCLKVVRSRPQYLEWLGAKGAEDMESAVGPQRPLSSPASSMHHIQTGYETDDVNLTDEDDDEDDGDSFEDDDEDDDSGRRGGGGGGGGGDKGSDDVEDSFEADDDSFEDDDDDGGGASGAVARAGHHNGARPQSRGQMASRGSSRGGGRNTPSPPQMDVAEDDFEDDDDDDDFEDDDDEVRSSGLDSGHGGGGEQSAQRQVGDFRCDDGDDGHRVRVG